jgi:hypothetical protein
MWLQRPVTASETQPLMLRVAIISHPAEFSRRKAIRDHMPVGVPHSEVNIQYYFFLGKAEDTTWSRLKGSSAQEVHAAVHREAEEHDDIHFLDMVDNKNRLGYKRWRAIQWVCRTSNSVWDFSSDKWFIIGRQLKQIQKRMIGSSKLHHGLGFFRSLRRSRSSFGHSLTRPPRAAKTVHHVGPDALRRMALARFAQRPPGATGRGYRQDAVVLWR